MSKKVRERRGRATSLLLLSKPLVMVAAVLDVLVVCACSVPGAMAEGVLAIYFVCHVLLL